MKNRVYGGTFNPPHLGHLTAARAVFDLLNWTSCCWCLRDCRPITPLARGGAHDEQQRLEMTRLAAEQLGLGDRVQVLDLELRRQGKSYTADTLSQIRELYPEAELWLLMGTDMFLTLQTWALPRPSRSGGHCRLRPHGRGHGGAVLRPAGVFVPDLPGCPDLHPDHSRRGGHLLHGAAGAAVGGPGANLLAPAVYGYILREGLYGTGRLEASASVQAAACGPELTC